ncbi:PREDICTED: dehydrogenase/reductase SDR family member on chromosome X-like, partial [Rhagoletis zephyria]|uniref:dehydrogenase/reductase SDR family member on chromosome X-like n=1 Tax=Rhagoletis zephyria TaxID=28612 RepID=UPI0008116B40
YVAVVTGGSRGIGLSVATELYRRGATVVVTAHGLTPPEREQLAERIRNGEKLTAEKDCGDDDSCDKENDDKLDDEDRLHIYQIDLRDLGAVCRFAEHLTDRFGGRLSLLVNNAGVMYVPLAYTEDGFEEHYQVNYLAHALLTWLLLPALQRGGGSSYTGPSKHTHPSRIVNVSSSTHYARDLFLEDLQSRASPYSPYHAYAQSKLAILMHTYWLAEWLKEHENQEDNPPSVLVNTLHPGVVNTALYENV